MKSLMQTMLRCFEGLLLVSMIVAIFAMFGCSTTSKGQGEWSVFFGTTIGYRQQGAASEANAENSIHLEDGVLEWLIKSSDTTDGEPDGPD